MSRTTNDITKKPQVLQLQELEAPPTESGWADLNRRPPDHLSTGYFGLTNNTFSTYSDCDLGELRIRSADPFATVAELATSPRSPGD